MNPRGLVQRCQLRDLSQIGIAEESEVSLIFAKQCGRCLLICLILGLRLMAQTAGEPGADESADGTPASVASGDHDRGKDSQGILIDSKPDACDAFLASPHGKRIVGALSVLSGLMFLLTRRIVGCGDEPKKGDTVAEYVAVIRQEALLLLGYAALMLGTTYLVWSIFSVHLSAR